MVYHILKNEIDLILPQFPARQKCGVITTLISGFLGLAYEGISSFCITEDAKPYTNQLSHGQ